MRAATLFSGIGAPEQAMPGWRWLWSAEVDPFASAVLAARHPSSVNLGDVTAPDFVERVIDAGRPDVLVFGSPCQSFSIAGKRGGLDDPRGNMALVALGVVRDLCPQWFVFENVPGLLSSDGGRDFGALLGIMGQLGYGFAYRVLDAQFFGVPQRRRRVFVVGRLGDWRPAAAVLFEPESLCGHPPPSREAGERVAGTLEAVFGEKRGLDNQSVNNGLPLCVAHALRAEGFDASEDGTGRGTPLVPVAFHARQDPDSGPVTHPIDTNGFSIGVAFQESQFGTAEYDVAGTQRSGRPGHTNNVRVGHAVRRITPLEAERLQGFPDGYTAVVHRGKPAADGPRYRVLGNSMAVPCVWWILERLERADAVGKAGSAAA